MLMLSDSWIAPDGNNDLPGILTTIRIHHEEHKEKETSQ